MKHWKLCPEAKGMFAFCFCMIEAKEPGSRALPSRNGHSQSGLRMSWFRGFLSYWNSLQIKRSANDNPVMTHFWLAKRKENSLCDCIHTDLHICKNGGGLFLSPTPRITNGPEGPDFAKIPSLQCCGFQQAKLKDYNSYVYLFGHGKELHLPEQPLAMSL